MKHILPALLLSLGALVNAPSATYHVSPNGADSNPGTPQSPFLTIQKALEQAEPGDTVLLSSGLYDEVVQSRKPGEADAQITIDGQNAAQIRRLVLGHPFHRVQNLKVSGYTNNFSSLVWMLRGAHHSIVSNLVLDGLDARTVDGVAWQGPTTKPFGADAASNCLIVSNRITGLRASTALFVYGANNLLTGNYVHDIGQCDFVRLFGQTNIIRANTFTNNFRIVGEGNHIDFIQTFGVNGFGSEGHIIEGNIINRIQEGQLTQLEGNVIPQIRDWTFRNNIFANVDLQASCTVPGVKYYNNLFYRCNTVNTGAALNFGARSYPEGVNFAHGARVINNVFLECGGENNTKGWYNISTNLNDVIADYNYVAGSNFSPKRENTLRQKIGDESGWNAFRWWEENGVNGGDPGFISVANFDFTLKPTSPLKNRGLPVPGLTADFNGSPRPLVPSIGPFELAAPTPPSGLRVIK